MNPSTESDAGAPDGADRLQLQGEVARLRAELDEFTYAVSHDLKAPLRHVTAYLQILREDLAEAGLPDGMAAHLNTASQAARQMGQQIDALLELSRLTRAEVQLTPLDIGPLVRDACTTLEARHAGRALRWQLAPDFPLLQADAALVRQVLMHLLSNALKFTAPRAVAEVHVGWRTHDSGLCALTVTDNGVGFNPQYTGKLFRAFQRLHSVREYDGLGMGLALTRKIVERHGGAVWAQGALDGGCCVGFTLPLAAPG